MSASVGYAHAHHTTVGRAVKGHLLFSRFSGQWNRCGGRDPSAKELETGAVEILMASDTFVNDVIISISFGIFCV